MEENEHFINRHRELAQLEREYSSTESSFVILYGRRRMGKTSLIYKFLEDKKEVFYFFSDRDSEINQINKFKNLVAKNANDKLMQNIDLKHWDECIEYFLQKLNNKKRTILVIDEFQFLVMANPALPSILQKWWDTELKKRNIILLLCGSHVSMMLKHTLNYGSPLYGRRTASMQITPIKFQYVSEFFPKNTPLQTIVEYYAVTSGIPKYVEVLKKEANIFDAILQHILTKDAFFYNEPRFILGEELHDQFVHFSILKTISNGHHKLGDIAASLNEKNNKLSPYIELLKELEIIERKVPITEKYPQKSRRGLYFIKDNLMCFWFKYVFQHQHLLEMYDTKWVLEKIKSEFNQFVSLPFEEICTQEIARFCPFVPQKVGKWWEKNEEIDIVALNDDTKEILLAECKWTDQAVDVDVFTNLVRKMPLVDWNKGNRKVHYMIFSKSGFTNALKNVKKETESLILVDLKQLKSK